MEQTFIAQGATPEMLERRLWELQQRLETLGSAHESLVGYVQTLEERLEEQEQTIELLRKTIDETLDRKMRSMSRRISEATDYRDYN